jgi:DNA-binding response OmpR family regulator
MATGRDDDPAKKRKMPPKLPVRHRPVDVETSPTQPPPPNFRPPAEALRPRPREPLKPKPAEPKPGAMRPLTGKPVLAAGRKPSGQRHFTPAKTPVATPAAAAALVAAPKPAPPPAAVLLVGSGFAMLEALTGALESRGLAVETTTRSELLNVVVAAAPDLIVLVGDAASDGGQESVRALSSSKLSSVVPVALLTDQDKLDARVRAFRHGIAAFIKSSASVDAIASEITRLAGEIPDREGIQRGSAGRTTLADIVDLLSNEVRSGILSVTPGGSTGSGGVQVVLAEGRPVTQIIDEFIKQLKTQVVSAEPLDYEFDERAAGTVQLLSADSVPPPSDDTNLAGIRVVIADEDAARADAVADALRREGVVVLVTDLGPEGARFERMRMLDPAILMIGERQLKRGAELVRRMRADPRLRWVSLLVVRWQEIWPEDAVQPNIESLRRALASLIEPERAIAALARHAPPPGFDTRLEILGPARLLKALAQAERPLRLTLHSGRISVSIDIAQGLVVGATGQTFGPGAMDLAGLPAVAAMLVLGSGRVRVDQVEQAREANLMAPVEMVLEQALAEEPPIPPSLAPTGGPLRAVEAALAPQSSRPPASPSERQAVEPPTLVTKPAVGAQPSEPPRTPRSESLRETPVSAGLAEPAPPPAPAPKAAEPPPMPAPPPVPSPAPAPAAAPARSRSLGWLIAVLALAGLVAAALLVRPLLDRGSTPPAPSAEPPAPSAPATASSDEPAPPPTASAANEPASASLIDRAASGDPDALAELEAMPAEERSPEASVALVRGRAAAKRRELDELRRSLKGDPARARSSETIERLVAYSRDPETAPDALRTAAELPGPGGPDLLYETWTGTAHRTPTTELAAELLASSEVRAKASPALAAVLDLRRAKSCEQVQELLPRVAKEGDLRAFRPLVKLLTKTGCGPTGALDCYPCLRGTRGLNEAISAVERRPAPAIPGAAPSAPGGGPPQPARPERPGNDKPPAHRPREP